MNWPGLFSGLVSLLNRGAEIWNNRQLRKAGKAEAKLENLEEEKRATEKAIKIRNQPVDDDESYDRVFDRPRDDDK